MKLHLSALCAVLALAGNVCAQEIKDSNPPVGAEGGPSPTFGPDAFGYVGFDQTQPECTVQFVDITATGTLVVSGDDVGAAQALPGPAFNLYGTTVTSLAATSNGYLSTDVADTGPDLSNDCPLPATPSTPGGTTGARIYPVHDDLISDVLFQYFASCPRPSGWGGPEGCYVFQYNNANHFGGADNFSFQVILYDTSFGIVFQNATGNSEAGSGSTTGIQNSGATIGLTYACDTAASIPDNSAQCIYHPQFPFGAGATADLSLTKTAAAPDPIVIGSTITYTLTAGNAGIAAVTDAVVTDTLPANVTYVSNTCGATFAAPTLTWNLGALAVSGTATCDVVVTVNAVGQITNSATISSSRTDPNPADNTGTSTLAGAFLADLSITAVSDAPASLGVGQQYTYTITGTNAGPSDATGLLFSMLLPTKISFVSSTCGAAAAGNIVSWSVPALASGASTSCDITVAVVAPGDIIVTADVTSATPDPNLVNNATQIVVGFQATQVPTLGHLGLLLIGLILAGAGVVAVRRS